VLFRSQSNKFILGFISGETKRILVESKAGIAVDPSNPKLLAKTIMKLKNKPEIINRIVMNNYGPEYVKKNYDKKKLLNKLEFNFKNIIEEFRIVKNIKNIPLDKNFSLSGLNLAFLGYWVKKKIRITKDTYLWSDGFFYKRFFKSKDLNKIPGRDIINNINFPNTIKRIFIIGNLEIKSKTHLENLYKKKIIHIPLGQGSAQQLYKNIPNIKFLETDVIYLTLPTPKQEEFADLIMKNNNFYKIFCIGGAINIASGVEKQVPLILEKFNLEFIWRLRTDTFRRLKRLVVSGLSYFKGEFTFKFININKKILNEK
jgi:UDP-N-acetyl-D-mannosaminuronic acid transferase (WecB/TagA/CpsF family)